MKIDHIECRTDKKVIIATYDSNAPTDIESIRDVRRRLRKQYPDEPIWLTVHGSTHWLDDPTDPNYGKLQDKLTKKKAPKPFNHDTNA